VRIGLGYDSHRLIPDRPLILGGVTIPFGKGLDGWSDADALTHAVMDALCGALGLGNIGVLFPPGDERFKNMSSLCLLEDVMQKVDSRGLRVVNVDAVIIAENPRLAPYVDKMRQSIAQALRMDASDVSVKPKSAEGMGAVGRGEGIVVHAVVLLES